MSDDNTPSILDLIKMPAKPQDGPIQCGSVTYTQLPHVEPSQAAPPSREWTAPVLSNVVPQLHAPEPVTAARFEGGHIVDPAGNLTNIAAAGIQDDNTIVIVNVANDQPED